jgi:hypothetical protein
MRCSRRGPTGRVIHEGPVEHRPHMTEWLRVLLDGMGEPTDTLLEQYHCARCGSDAGLTPDEVARAERRAA